MRERDGGAAWDCQLVWPMSCLGREAGPGGRSPDSQSGGAAAGGGRTLAARAANEDAEAGPGNQCPAQPIGPAPGPGPRRKALPGARVRGSCHPPRPLDPELPGVPPGSGALASCLPFPSFAPASAHRLKEYTLGRSPRSPPGVAPWPRVRLSQRGPGQGQAQSASAGGRGSGEASQLPTRNSAGPQGRVAGLGVTSGPLISAGP